jgi:hypothetical protein
MTNAMINEQTEATRIHFPESPRSAIAKSHSGLAPVLPA